MKTVEDRLDRLEFVLLAYLTAQSGDISDDDLPKLAKSYKEQTTEMRSELVERYKA